MWKDITNAKNKCKSRSCVWWLVLNLSWYRRTYLFLLNFDISFVSITVSTFIWNCYDNWSSDHTIFPFPFTLRHPAGSWFWFAVSNFELIPQYLRSLIPQKIQNISRYLLRNMNDLIVPNANRVLYANSFLPSTIRDWNSLDLNVRNSPSLNTFKLQISRSNGDVTIHPKFFDIIHTTRAGQIILFLIKVRMQ